MSRPQERALMTSKKGKRARSFVSAKTHTDTDCKVLLIANIHQLAYWCQWRLAISGACAEFNAAGEVEKDAWAQDMKDQINVEIQAKLCVEVTHLEAQLGRYTSVVAKLEAALAEKQELLAEFEKERQTAGAAVTQLKVQVARDQEAAAVSKAELEERISQGDRTRQSFEATLRERENVNKKSTQLCAKLTDMCSSLESKLAQGRQARNNLALELEAERARLEATKAELTALREKYSAVKRRLAEAGRKVESMRAERDDLRRNCATLEDKLADVEKFQMSERGQALDRMERELAEEKMTRVELEADRDELQTQLAAALEAARRR